MQALNELIRAGQRQGEALERQGVALDKLLRRPAPAPARRAWKKLNGRIGKAVQVAGAMALHRPP